MSDDYINAWVIYTTTDNGDPLVIHWEYDFYYEPDENMNPEVLQQLKDGDTYAYRAEWKVFREGAWHEDAIGGILLDENESHADRQEDITLMARWYTQ